MRIGIFTELYKPSIGGQEIRFEELAAAFLRKGHQVSVYCIGHALGLPQREVIDGVEVQRYPSFPAYQTRVLGLPRHPVAILKYAAWCRRVAAEQRFDLNIYNQWPLLHAPLAPAHARQRGVLDWCEIRDGRFYRFLQERLPRSTRFNMAVSPAVRAEIERVSGKPTFYIPSGINLGNYRATSRAERNGLLYLGRIAPHKNVGLLIEAFERLAQDGYQGRLIIAGGGPDLDNVTRAAQASAVAGRIDVLGRVSDQQKIDLLARVEALVIPSKREGFPRVVAEAMASGTPTATVAFPENGTKDVVEFYKCGIVCPPEAAELADGIRTLLAGWDEHSARCLERAPELDWEILVDRLLEHTTGKEH